MDQEVANKAKSGGGRKRGGVDENKDCVWLRGGGGAICVTETLIFRGRIADLTRGHGSEARSARCTVALL